MENADVKEKAIHLLKMHILDLDQLFPEVCLLKTIYERK